MNKDYSLPVNWFWVKLGDVGEVVAGGTPSTKVHEYFDGEIAWITPADLTGYRNKYISKGRRNISEEGLKNSSARLVPKDSILFSFRAPIGYVVIAANEISTNQGFKNLLPNKKVDSEFVYYYLKSAKRLAEENASGTTFKEISAKNFSRLPIPLPPLPEQKKIVEKIEELFSQLDSGVASLKKAKEQLRIYRQSVLAHALSGRLLQKDDIFSHSDSVQKDVIFSGKAAEPQSNYAPIKRDDIFHERDSIPKDVISNGIQLPEGLPAEDLAKAGWKWVKLGELISPSKERFEPLENDNQKYIGLEHIEKGTGKILGNENSDTVRSTKTIFSKGDLLYGKLRPYLNKVTIAEFNGVCSTDILVFNKREGLSNSFLKYRMLMEDFVSYAQNHMSGVQHPRINFKSLSEYDLMLPNYNQQTQIVEEIESRFAGSEALEKAINDSLTKAETLRQSILKRAFEGKLV